MRNIADDIEFALDTPFRDAPGAVVGNLALQLLVPGRELRGTFTLHRGVDRSAFFNWGEFLARDAVAKAFFARQGAQFRVLDLEPLHYRQDAHVAEDDCLHLCIPGPLNAIVPPLLTRVLGGFSSVASSATQAV